MELVDLEQSLYASNELVEQAEKNANALAAAYAEALVEADAENARLGGSTDARQTFIRGIDFGLQERFPRLSQDTLAHLDVARRKSSDANEHLAKSESQRNAIAMKVSEIYRNAILKEVELHNVGASEWDKRFHTSLAIGHGAAFAAIVNHVFDKDTSHAAILAAIAPASLFGIGLLAGGAIPLVRSQKAERLDAETSQFDVVETVRRRGRRLANFSAFCFIVGVVASLAGILSLSADNPPRPKDGTAPIVVRIEMPTGNGVTAAPGAQTKAVCPPTSSSAPAKSLPQPAQPAGTPAPPPRTSEPAGAASRP